MMKGSHDVRGVPIVMMKGSGHVRETLMAYKGL